MVEWLNMVESSESKRMVKICKSQGVFDQLPFVLVRLLRHSPYAKNVRVRQREGQGRCFQEGQTGVLALRRRYATIWSSEALLNLTIVAEVVYTYMYRSSNETKRWGLKRLNTSILSRFIVAAYSLYLPSGQWNRVFLAFAAGCQGIWMYLAKGDTMWGEQNPRNWWDNEVSNRRIFER